MASLTENQQNIINCNHYAIVGAFNLILAEIDREEYKTAAEVKSAINGSLDIYEKIHKESNNET
jgi:hypothetical protein